MSSPSRKILFLVLNFWLFGAVAAKDLPVEEWRGEWWDDIRQGLSKENLSNILFDVIDDVSLSEDIGDFEASIKAKRKVYNNHDISGSWSVVDKVILKGGIPFWLNDLNLPDVGSSPLRVSFGLETGIELINIRLVQPDQELLKRKSVKELEKKFLKSEIKDKNEDGFWMEVTNPEKKKTKRFFPWSEELNDVRFDNIWNILAFPFRLPLRADMLDDMDDFEIFSFNMHGMVDFGASLGWEVDIEDVIEGVEIDASYKVFLRGEFQVSVQKEQDHYVKLKVRKLGGRGHTLEVGSDDEGLEILDGIFLLEYLDNDIIPFSINLTKSKNRQIEVAYRYDITNPQAEDAYEKAVKGKLSLSDELSSNPDETGVEKLATRYSKINKKSKSTELRFFVFYKHSNQKRNDIRYTELHTPNGEVFHGVRATIGSTEHFRFFYGFEEIKRNQFYVTYEEENGHLDMIYERDIEDFRTSSYELARYVRDVERAIGDGGVFPRFPIYAPRDPNSKTQRRRSANFGTTKIYFRMRFPHEDLVNWMGVHEDDMWSDLESAFGVREGAWSNYLKRVSYGARYTWNVFWNLPLFAVNTYLKKGNDLFMAKKIKRIWKRLGNENRPRKRVELLSKILDTTYFGYEIIELFKARVPQQKVAYVLMAHSRVFGDIWREGNSVGDFTPPNNPRDDRLDFDELPPYHDVDQGAEISMLTVTRVDENTIKLEFVCEAEPENLFFRVKDVPRGFVGKRSNREIVLSGDLDLFDFGYNEMIVDLTDEEDPLWPLFEDLDGDLSHILQMSLSRDGTSWGPVISTGF